MSYTARQEWLSARGARIAGSKGILEQGFSMYLQDAYHRESNPQGILNVGTSENKLCFDLLQEKGRRVPLKHSGADSQRSFVPLTYFVRVSPLKINRIYADEMRKRHDSFVNQAQYVYSNNLSGSGMNYLEAGLFKYCDLNGIKSFREEIAKFLTEYGKALKPLSPDNITIMNGCNSIFSSLSTVLFDPGDGYLIPTPYYGSVDMLTGLYGGTQPVHVPLFSEGCDKDAHSFQLTVTKLEMAMKQAQEQGIKVRALILINPHNPLGDIYPAQLLKECLYFGHRHNLHVIIDEIYMFSIYGEAAFTSVLSLELPDPERTHFMWGFSKDFAMGGIRVGVLHSANQQVCRAVTKLASFHQCPGPIQHVLCQMISDRGWLDNVFFPTNKRRLRDAQNILVTGLEGIGIPVRKSSAGLFVWADFRKFMKTQTFEAEMEFWWMLIEKKLYICPGQAFYCYEPGWFRLVFSDSIDNIKLCIERLQKILQIVSCGSPQEMSALMENEIPSEEDSEEGKGSDSEICLNSDVSEIPHFHLEKIVVH